MHPMTPENIGTTARIELKIGSPSPKGFNTKLKIAPKRLKQP